MPATSPAIPLSEAPLAWLQAYVTLTGEGRSGDPDEDFRCRMDAIYVMRECRAGEGHYACDVPAAVIELGRRRGVSMPGPDRAPRVRGVRPPNWRVFGRAGGTDHATLVAVSEAAAALRAAGEQVTIWRWQDEWKLYEHSEPA